MKVCDVKVRDTNVTFINSHKRDDYVVKTEEKYLNRYESVSRFSDNNSPISPHRKNKQTNPQKECETLASINANCHISNILQ